MKTEIKEIYKCEYCNKLYQIKKNAAYHELMCSKNPANKRPCFECKHLNKRQTVIYPDNPTGYVSNELVLNLLHCKKKDIFIYPPKVEVKKNMYELGDDLNEPMPKQCSDFEISEFLECSEFVF